VPRIGAAGRAAVQLGAPAAALAYTLDGATLAVGDAGGGVVLAGANGDVRMQRQFVQPIRWLGFAADGTLLVASDSWLHALDAQLEPLHGKLVSLPPIARFAALRATVVRIIGVSSNGSLVSLDIDLAAPAPDAPADVPALVARNWPAALGLRLDDNGAPVPFDP
jgi:hypothetical protein